MFRRYVVHLRRALLVVEQKIELYGGGLRRLAVLTSLDRVHLAVLPEVLVVDKAERRLKPRLLKRLQDERLTDPSGREAAELLNKIDVLVRDPLVVMVFAGLCGCFEQPLCLLFHFLTGNYAPVIDRREVIKKRAHLRTRVFCRYFMISGSAPDAASICTIFESAVTVAL